MGQPGTAARSSALDRLIAKSQASPRTLLRLCAALLTHHVDRTSDLFLDTKDINAALGTLEPRAGANTEAALLPLPALAEAAPANGETTGLRLDDSGHVWLAGVPLDPPLTALEFRLLHTLYVAAPDIVLSEDLIAAVWDSSWTAETTLSAADEQNLRKLVARLRKRLNRAPGGKSQALVRNAHGRGYWLSNS